MNYHQQCSYHQSMINSDPQFSYTGALFDTSSAAVRTTFDDIVEQLNKDGSRDIRLRVKSQDTDTSKSYELFITCKNVFHSTPNIHPQLCKSTIMVLLFARITCAKSITLFCFLPSSNILLVLSLLLLTSYRFQFFCSCPPSLGPCVMIDF